MAEFCLDCWNKLNHTHLTQEDVILSEDLDLCEECAEVKSVIICLGKRRNRKGQSPPRRRHKRQGEQ